MGSEVMRVDRIPLEIPLLYAQRTQSCVVYQEQVHALQQGLVGLSIHVQALLINDCIHLVQVVKAGQFVY